MSEKLPSPEEKRDKKKESDFNKIERLKETLMKLEKSVIDEVDEGAQAARGAIQAMGFGITPIVATDDDLPTDQDEDDIDDKLSSM